MLIQTAHLKFNLDSMDFENKTARIINTLRRMERVYSIRLKRKEWNTVWKKYLIDSKI